MQKIKNHTRNLKFSTKAFACDLYETFRNYSFFSWLLLWELEHFFPDLGWQLWGLKVQKTRFLWNNVYNGKLVNFNFWYILNVKFLALSVPLFKDNELLFKCYKTHVMSKISLFPYPNHKCRYFYLNNKFYSWICIYS